jgi:hypothetical protein
MAVIKTLTEDERRGWDDWVASRPPVVRELARRLPPTRLYRLKVSGHRCTIHSYSEDGSVTVNVTGDYNRVLFGRRVFGIPPDGLEECDLPGPDEDLGDTSADAGYTDEDVRRILIPRLRAEHKTKGCTDPRCAMCLPDRN